MKKIYQLKIILDIVIVFSIFIMCISLFGLLLNLITGNMSKINITMLDQKVTKIDAPLAVVFAFVVIGYALFIYSIFQLRKLEGMFIRKEFFTDLSVKTLKFIGVSMLASSIVTIVPASIYGVVNSAKIQIKMNTISPESMLFSFIISLFFIILSYIFNEAKIMKEDNELVI